MSAMTNEQVRPIDGFNDYFVTNTGRILSAKRGKLRELKPSVDPRYKQVTLSSDGAYATKRVHRLVAEAFIPNPDSLPFVGHRNDDKLDNSTKNLYWTDPPENTTHNGVHLTIDRRRSFQASKEKFSIPVVGIDGNGNRVAFSSMREAEKHGFKNNKISECISGKRKTHKGYQWHKAEEWRGPQEAGKGEAE